MNIGLDLVCWRVVDFADLYLEICMYVYVLSEVCKSNTTSFSIGLFILYFIFL